MKLRLAWKRFQCCREEWTLSLLHSVSAHLNTRCIKVLWRFFSPRRSCNIWCWTAAQIRSNQSEATLPPVNTVVFFHFSFWTFVWDSALCPFVWHFKGEKPPQGMLPNHQHGCTHGHLHPDKDSKEATTGTVWAPAGVSRYRRWLVLIFLREIIQQREPKTKKEPHAASSTLSQTVSTRHHGFAKGFNLF